MTNGRFFLSPLTVHPPPRCCGFKTEEEEEEEDDDDDFTIVAAVVDRASRLVASRRASAARWVRFGTTILPCFCLADFWRIGGCATLVMSCLCIYQ